MLSIARKDKLGGKDCLNFKTIKHEKEHLRTLTIYPGDKFDAGKTCNAYCGKKPGS